MFELLLQYYKNWFSVYMKRTLDIDMEVISFEEMIEDYDSSLNKIGKFLEQTPKGVDVRLPNENVKTLFTQQMISEVERLMIGFQP